MTVEEYSTKILEEVGPTHWVRHLMKELESAGPMSKHTNVAIEIVRNFPVIVFSSSGKQPIRARYLGHVTGYQPIRDQYFLVVVRSVTLSQVLYSSNSTQL